MAAQSIGCRGALGWNAGGGAAVGSAFIRIGGGTRGRDAPGTAGRMPALPKRAPSGRTAEGGFRYMSPYTGLSGPGARRFPGGRFGETSPPGALARRDNRRRAGARGRGPAWLDRTKHKQRVARPRKPTFAPRVLPGHFEAGPPPLGRAYKGYEGGLRPSRLAPNFPHGPGTAPWWPELPLHSRTDCRKDRLWKSVTTQQKRCDESHWPGLWKTGPLPRRGRAPACQTGRQ